MPKLFRKPGGGIAGKTVSGSLRPIKATQAEFEECCCGVATQDPVDPPPSTAIIDLTGDLQTSATLSHDINSYFAAQLYGELTALADLEGALTWSASCDPYYDRVRDNLIMDWRLNEATGTTATDNSPEALNGTYSSAIGASQYNNDFITIGTEDLYGVLLENPGTTANTNTHNIYRTSNIDTRFHQNLTVSMFFKPTNLPTTTGQVIQRLMTLSNTNSSRVGLGLEPVSGTPRLVTFRDGGAIVVTSASGLLQNDTWYHALVTFENISSTSYEHKLYLNGNLVGTGSGVTTRNSNRLFVGSLSGNTRGFRGVLSNFRVYNRVLTATEIEELADRCE